MVDWYCEKGSKSGFVLNDDAISVEYFSDGFKK
jgi:hypothetical protein